jgi:hypothetical protein
LKECYFSDDNKEPEFCCKCYQKHNSSDECAEFESEDDDNDSDYHQYGELKAVKSSYQLEVQMLQERMMKLETNFEKVNSDVKNVFDLKGKLLQITDAIQDIEKHTTIIKNIIEIIK